MSTQLVQPEFRVRIDHEVCHKCGRCVQQCGWGVYSFTERPIPDHAACRAHQAELTGGNGAVCPQCGIGILSRFLVLPNGQHPRAARLDSS